jgi:hypothetical protein
VDPVNRSSHIKIAVAVIVIIMAGFAVRLLFVHVTSGIDVPPGCEVESDFWKGDQVLC